jgi:hypothetical protein
MSVDYASAVLTCPDCGGKGYHCAKSDHGAVDGPALHCHRSPHHNAWTEEQFARWVRP